MGDGAAFWLNAEMNYGLYKDMSCIWLRTPGNWYVWTLLSSQPNAVRVG